MLIRRCLFDFHALQTGRPSVGEPRQDFEKSPEASSTAAKIFGETLSGDVSLPIWMIMSVQERAEAVSRAKGTISSS